MVTCTIFISSNGRVIFECELSMSFTMNSLISFVLHPLIPVNVGEDDEATGIDVIYPLTICFAFGIWLVYHRYNKMHNSPVPFTVEAPQVCYKLIIIFSLLTASLLACRPPMGVACNPESPFRISFE